MKRLALLCVLACGLASCAGTAKLSSSEHATEREVQTRIQIQTQIDSVLIYKRDSIYIREKNDTVVIEKWHTSIKYRDKLRIDTLHVSDTVTINHSTTETVEVEVNRLTGWQSAQIWAGRLSLLICLVVATYFVFKLRNKLKL
jgi:hypothetical protein